MAPEVTTWLLDQEPWTRIRARRELLGLSPDHPDLLRDYSEIKSHPLVTGLVKELNSWPGPAMKRHNDAKLLYHKLVFMAELGLPEDLLPLGKTIDRILASASEEGPFRILGNIPIVFGGTGKDEQVWMLCDAPLLVYALVKLGLEKEPVVQRALAYLVGLQQEFGWPCAADASLGKKFKGPGKRTDPCPYANLIMLRLLGATEEFRDSGFTRKGAEILLDLWEHRKEARYFMFGMGTDFAKLKAPFVWFDIMHYSDVMSRLPFLWRDPGLEEIMGFLQDKQDPDGRYTAESIYRSWSGWDFGQKKAPSGWITVNALCAVKRWKNDT